MALLRKILTVAGLVEVQTYIQSGNVLCRSHLTATQVEKLVHDEIQKHFGGDLAIVARTPAQVRKIVEGNPFKKADIKRVNFTILSTKPDKQNVRELTRQDFHPDELVITDEVVYVHCPISYGTSKLSNNFLEKKLGVSATIRNYNTLTKLIELSSVFK